MKGNKSILCLFLVLGALSACSESVEEVPIIEIESNLSTEIESNAEENTLRGCIDESDISYLCGPINAEDILRIGDSEWLLVSGMNGELSGSDINGTLHLVNHENKTYDILFPGTSPVIEHNSALFPDCPGPIDSSNISVHGLTIQALDNTADQYRVYMTSHGAREAIEVFNLDASSKPTIKWIGCIIMPASSWTNSVAILSDGGFFATQFMEPEGPGIVDVLAGKNTGHVFEWHPGEEVVVIPDTELSGANGIVTSSDERFIYVAAFGTHEITRFDTSVSPIGKESIKLKIMPDNIRWSTDGTLYTAGNFAEGECDTTQCAWGVYEINPDTLEAELISSIGNEAAMGDASSALLVGDEIWIGTYGGDRLGILLKP